MESILAIFCIVSLTILMYGLIQSSNINKFHKYNCHTLYIPEDLDLEEAFKSVDNLSLDSLKKRARVLGASREFIDKYNKEEDKKYLKSFIIQESISDEHILFDDITKKIDTRENINKREYCRKLEREGKTDDSCPKLPAKLEDYSNVIIPTPTNKLERDHVLLEYEFLQPEEIIDYMKQYQEDYEDINYSFFEDN
tara:strand:+ start:261 stop:848 length:588 start_codon:yes stop_codon:yes gene_type:complete